MTEPTPNPAVNRWVRVLLVVSLAVNLLVAGVVVGALLNGPPDRRTKTSSAEMALPYTRALEDQDRRKVRRELRRKVFSDREEQGALARSYVSAVDTLRDVPFNPASLQAVMDEQSQTARARMSIGQQVLVAVIADMSEAERAAYADRLEAELAKLEKRGKAWRQGAEKPDR